MADLVVPPVRPVLPARPAAEVPELPWATRKALAGQWPELEKTVSAGIVWAPAEAEWQALRAVGWVQVRADAVFEVAPAKIAEGRAWADKTLGVAWVSVKAWVRKYLGLKAEKPAAK